MDILPLCLESHLVSPGNLDVWRSYKVKQGADRYPTLASGGPARSGKVLMTMATVETTTNVTDTIDTTFIEPVN